MTINLKFIAILFIGLFLFRCSSLKRSKNKPYEYGWYPKTYQEAIDNFENYSKLLGCKQGETIASIGAGNGRVEVEVSYVVDDIHWYLQEIDSSRLYQFDKVLEYHEELKGMVIKAEFNLVVGTETSTNLPQGIFDRVIMINVFHEIIAREPIMLDIRKLLKPDGKLVIMERMGSKLGQIHGDCKHLKLYEPDFLKEMDDYGYESMNHQVGEEISALTFYTFKSIAN